MPTHLDYRGSFEEYAAAKWNIQKNMTADDYLVLNFNQDWAREWLAKLRLLLILFQQLKRWMVLSCGAVLTFRGEAIYKGG